MEEALACIDLASDDVASSVDLLRQACLDSGFFYVKNHGVNSDLVREAFEQSKAFFDLPSEEKVKSLRNERHRGYTPLLDETLDPSKQVKGDCKEGYYISAEIPEDDLRTVRCFYGPNVWPSAELLPHWRDTMMKYHSELLIVGRRIASLIALALKLDANFFAMPGRMDDPIATLRLLHYSGEVSRPESGIYGAGAHSDWGLITLLATDGTPGLQICKEKHMEPRVWKSVQPVEGAFIVNLGDMLEHWSNGVFKSTLHRVMTCGQERYSIAFFLDPNYDCLVECLETCISKDNPPKFAPVLAGEYLLGRYGETHAKDPSLLVA